MEEMAKKYRLYVHTIDDKSAVYNCLDFNNNQLMLAITISEGHIVTFMRQYIRMFEVKDI